MQKERQNTLVRSLFAGAGLIFFYGWMGLLFSFYETAYARVLLTFLWGALSGLVGSCFVQRKYTLTRSFWQLLGILFTNCIFGFAVLLLALRHPDLFKVSLFQMDRDASLLFLPTSLVAFSLAFHVQRKYKLQRQLVRLTSFLDEHGWGILLAGIFFVSYFILAIIFNRTEIRIVDSFFEADNTNWLYFLGMDGAFQPVTIRVVHPLAYLIMRPLTWLMSLFLNGDTYFSILFVIAGAGAFSVFLVWVFLRKSGLGKVFSLLSASVLGVTTTHLLFGSFAESYIFSAAAILLFFVILQRKSSSLKSLVPAGVLIFGITISNVIQTLVGLFFVRKNIKLMIRYLLLLLFFAVLLSVVNNAIYPYESSYFFMPDKLLNEQKYTQSVFDFPAWKLQGRIYATVRNLFFYTVVAPSFFFTLPDPGKPLPRFSFFSFSPGQFSHSSYDGLGNLTLIFWLALLLFSGLRFLWTLREKQNWDAPVTLFSIALLANIAYNLFFHVIYGEDPFLYSADWAYALVLFVALSFTGISRRWWSKVLLAVFLVIVMINNFLFIGHFIEVLDQAI